ncbi:M3 family metallopeptidase [Undibacterium oligocarboniphilum]|uniref:oligopeptidase A n=1 Tax=Undibacterium oligocarboniphilum TaxID=666702 RepID=A0A850QSQ6_9BURK|nr:M3 family metallopeptidase [Undibacterium oligocarboniphilum]MBC3871575.1 M3 family metallopeptidase [Undibacterium oligocarboniphilum]NVO79066.1 M3 family metallopeptidase [Undibacterium oligocarboniphilum]
MTDHSPLLDLSDLPRFTEISAEQISPAIQALLTENRAVIDRLTNDRIQVSWENIVEPLENATEKLARVWGVVSHLNAVADTPELRAAYNENQPAVTEFWTELGQNLTLFSQYKALLGHPEFASWPAARQTIIRNAIRDFRLGGAELPAEQKQRYAEIQEKQAQLSTRFSENVLDATNAYELLIEDRQQLRGLPEDAILAAKNAAEREQKNGYKFTLHFPSYFPLLQYADERSVRETIYRANATKASELGAKPEWDNTVIITELLQLRREEARLLGYRNFAEVSLVSKMAESPEQVSRFLEDLAQRARPYAEKDLQELREFAAQQLGIEKLEAWDVAYASEKLREQRYAFSEHEVKQYFPEPQVIQGLFLVIQTLFGVSIQPDHASVWHPDVKFYRIEKDNQLIGQFYLDLYARNGKRGGAWMDDVRGRRLKSGNVQTPVAYLVCNFTEPAIVDGVTKPACFTHDEVITLFHEFGHGLHHLLTQVDELSVSGISGVEWDAVELPSQFMENFCWEWDVLQQMTAHAESGETLPRSLYDKMLAAKNFQSGLQTLRQVEFALFDMRLHDQFDPHGIQSVQDILNTVREQVSVFTAPEFNRLQHSFSHIFAGGYAAGYYSYKWAEVLSADAFAAFEEHGQQNGSALSRHVGQKFRQEVLEMGGSRPALESFKAFRGREPQIDALLRHSGMAA